MNQRETEVSPPPRAEASSEVEIPDPLQLTLADNPWLTKLREAPVDEAWLAEANEVIPIASTSLFGVQDINTVQRVDNARENFYGELLGLAQPWRKLHNAYRVACSITDKKHLPLPSVFIETQRRLYEYGIDNGKLLKNSYAFSKRVGPLNGLILAIQKEGMIAGDTINANGVLIEMSGDTFGKRLRNGEAQGFKTTHFVRSRLIGTAKEELNSRLRRADRMVTIFGQGHATDELRQISNAALLTVSGEKTFLCARIAAMGATKDLSTSELASMVTRPTIAHMVTLALGKPYNIHEIREVDSLPLDVKQTIVEGFIEQRQAERKKTAKEAGFVDDAGEGDDSRLKAEPIDKIIRAYQRYVEATEKRKATRASK